MTFEIAIETTKKPKPRPAEDSYGFGRFFSDHMFISEYTSERGWQSPRVVPYQNLSLDPGAAVLHYGQALFEGMKAFRGQDGKVRLFRPEMNWRRMTEGSARLCMKLPPLDLFLESLMQLVRTDLSWVPSRPGTALYLRPTLIGSEGFLGVRPSEHFIYYVIASPVGSYYSDGAETVQIWVERKYSRAAAGGIGAVKAGGNYASSLLGATEAKKRGYSQVLWLDAAQKKFIEEVGTMNVFFRLSGPTGDRVVTPALGGTILPGVMRDSVIQLLESRHVAVEQRTVSLDEIIEAHRKGELKEVFGTGTAASISPVGMLGLEDQTLTINEGKVGPLASELMKYVSDLQYGRIPDEMGWTVEVPPSK